MPNTLNIVDNLYYKRWVNLVLCQIVHYISWEDYPKISQNNTYATHIKVFYSFAFLHLGALYGVAFS